MSGEAFAAQEGIGRSSLHGWASRFKHLDAEGSGAHRPRFVAVTVASGEATDRAGAVIRWGEATISVGADADPRWVAELVRSLTSC